MAPITIAPPLREVAELKIEEFNQLKQDFKTRYGIGIARPTDINPRDRVATLVKKIQQYDSYLEDDSDITTIAHYVEQAGDDSCVSDDKILKIEEQVLDKLHKQINRHETTSLHLDLMREVMTNNLSLGLSTAVNTVNANDDFEVVDNGLELLWERFEAETFVAKAIDTEALEVYLTSLMERKDSLDGLDRLRECLCQYGSDILEGDADIEEEELEWCIMDLIQNGLISETKKQALASYIQNSVATKELLGMLNTKSIHDWKWKHADKGLPVTARQDSDGNYHITVEEDLIDMLFLHCRAIGWAQKLREVLSDFAQNPGLSDYRRPSANNCNVRKFFLEKMPPEPVEEQLPRSPADYPPPPPPPPGPFACPPPPFVYPHDSCIVPALSQSKKKKKKASKSGYIQHHPIVMPMVPPPPLPPHLATSSSLPPHILMSSAPVILQSLEEERYRSYRSNFLMSRLPTREGCRPKVVPIDEVQANLIKTLATEMKLRVTFDGDFGCSVIDFHSLASALPHKTVLVVLKFLGVPEAFLDLFTRFLAAKLRIGHSVNALEHRLLTRAQGISKHHGLELLFTEAVMFFAELAVYKNTGAILYRLGSKCYFVGTEDQNTEARQALSVFSKHTGLDYRDMISQPKHLGIGFLDLSGHTISVQNPMVEVYAHDVKRRLSAEKTVYDWVRVWNDTVGTFASHLFGPLAEVAGKSHLDAVRAAYKRILNVIFEGSNVTCHVQDMLRARSEFARTSPPLALEAIVHLPQAFGGLGVKNPLIIFHLARNLGENSASTIQEYLDAETHYYQAALSNWSRLQPDDVSRKLKYVFKDNEEAITAALGSESAFGAFMTKAALTKHRECAPYQRLPVSLLHGDILPRPPKTRIPYLNGVYTSLLQEPIEYLVASDRILDEVRNCGNCKPWGRLNPQDKWVLQMYGDECFERYGTLEIWNEKHVPFVCMLLARGVDLHVEDDSSSDLSS